MPIVPAHKSLAVNKKPFLDHLQTMEVAGSNPAAPIILSRSQWLRVHLRRRCEPNVRIDLEDFQCPSSILQRRANRSIVFHDQKFVCEFRFVTQSDNSDSQRTRLVSHRRGPVRLPVFPGLISLTLRPASSPIDTFGMFQDGSGAVHRR